MVIFQSKSFSNNFVIKYKIASEIITNQDIVNEIKYLIAFNNDLKVLPKNQLLQIAVRSKVKEKIKYLEVIKYFDLNKPNLELEELVKSNLIKNLNLSDFDQIKDFMIINNISLPKRFI